MCLAQENSIVRLKPATPRSRVEHSTTEPLRGLPSRTVEQAMYPYNFRPLAKSMYQKIIFLISHPKHILWVLKRAVSMSTKIYVKTDG